MTYFFKTSYQQPPTQQSIQPLQQPYSQQQLQQQFNQQQQEQNRQQPFVSRFRKPPLGEPVVALEDPEYEQSIVSQHGVTLTFAFDLEEHGLT